MPEATGHPAEKIVVGVDGSESSKEALAWAGRQAKLTQSPLEIVSAWEFPTTVGWIGPWPEGLDLAANAGDELAKLIPEVLGPEPGIALRQSVVEGHPALVLETRSRDASLLVVGSRGHGAFAGMLLGSVSAHLASHAHCPVVIVHEQTTHVARE